jgi:hypothetical protein
MMADIVASHIITKMGVKFVIYDRKMEEIVAWIPQL